MNLKALIEAQGFEPDASYESIATALNVKPLINNPETQGTIPAPLTIDALIGLVPFSEFQSISAVVFQDWFKGLVLTDNNIEAAAKRLMVAMSGRASGTVLEAIDFLISQQEKSTLADFILVLVADGKLSSSTSAQLNTVLSATIPDPNYREQIEAPSLAQQHGLGTVTGEMIQEAMN